MNRPTWAVCASWEWSNLRRGGVCLRRRFMTWGQTVLHQHGQHIACAVVKNELHAQERGGHTGSAMARMLPRFSCWREPEHMEVWDLHSSSFHFGLSSTSGCHLHWKMIPVSLLELYDSLRRIDPDRLWRGVQRYAWIDSCTAPITQAWHERIQ